MLKLWLIIINTLIMNSLKVSTASETIVTAYYQIPSKFDHIQIYRPWIKNMMSLHDNMVIFTEENQLEFIQKARKNKMNKTIIIIQPIAEVPIATKLSKRFWKHQWEINPEREIHKSIHLLWIWLSKTWFVSEALRKNPFNSNVFVWCDIGAFRDTTFNDKLWITHQHIIPQNRMLLMAFKQPKIPQTIWIQKSIHEITGEWFTGGGILCGRVTTWNRFHTEFVKTIKEYSRRNLFIGDDQPLYQSTCMRTNHMCSYVLPNMVRGDAWFGLEEVLHTGALLKGISSLFNIN